jgi:PAS domain S-box-containing protein
MSNQNNEAKLNEMNESLQDFIVKQAGKLININLYTKSLLSSLPVALISTDKDGSIQVANKAAEEMLQIKSKAIKGSSLIDLLALSPAIVKHINVSQNRETRLSAESLDLIMADGEKRVVNIHVRPFYDEENNRFGTLLAMEDQTYIRFLRDSFKQHSLVPEDGDVVDNSPKMEQAVKNLAELYANDDPVLFSGPSGAGKAFLASKLHRNRKDDHEDSLIMVDCRGIDDAKARETLFGSNRCERNDKEFIHFKSLHDYGTIHLAEGGTLILKNIDALGADGLQALNEYIAKTRDADTALPKCRIAATTEIDPLLLEKGEGFSKPLIKVLLENHISVPALRRRRKDILPLTRLFLTPKDGKNSKTLSREAENELLTKEYDLNNARELKDAIDLAALVADGDEIRSEHIFTGPQEQPAGNDLDVTDSAFIQYFTADKILRFLRAGVFAALIAYISLLMFYPEHVAGVIGNKLTWGLGWPAAVFVFLFLGRIFCSVCPFSYGGRIAAHAWSLLKTPPDILKTLSPFLIPAGFALILWAEHVFHMSVNPRATSLLLIAILSGAVCFSLIFDRETWCRYLCPLGNFFGLFSFPASIFIRSNPSVCSTKCSTHDCHVGSEQYDACPVFHHPLYARNANICKLCFNCLKSCPYGSARFYLRPPLVRTWQQKDISDTVGLFALVFFFLAPGLLASERFEYLSGAFGFSIMVFFSLLLALASRYSLPPLLFYNDKLKLPRAIRLFLVMFILGWGPFAAYEISQVPGLDSLSIVAGQSDELAVALPAHGISLLVLAQLGAIWLGALLGAVTLVGMNWGRNRETSHISRRVWFLLVVICLCYPIICTWLIW